MTLIPSMLLPCGRQKQKQTQSSNPELINELKNRLKVFLSDKQLKFTEQRWSIALTILQTGGHLDAQQIVEKVRAIDSSIGAATVYRTLKVLCDAEILEKSHQDMGGRVLYELPHDDHHDHIICLDCQEIFEFHDERIEDTQNEVAKKLKFQVHGHRHVIYAHCDFIKKKRGT